MVLPQVWGALKGQITKIANSINSYDRSKLRSPNEVEILKAKIESLRVVEVKIQELTPQLESLIQPEDIKYEHDRITILMITIEEMIDEAETSTSFITPLLDNVDLSQNNLSPSDFPLQNRSHANNQPQNLNNPSTPISSNAGNPPPTPSSPFENLMAQFLLQQSRTNEMFTAALLQRQTSTPSPVTDEILQNLTNIVRTLTENQTTPSDNSHLPTLSVPQFSGEFSAWNSFKDMYLSTIHNNNRISKTHKMQYLQSYLTGDAKCLIESIEISEDNYDAAWQSLMNRYEDQNALINANIKRLMSLPKVLIESAKALSQIHSTANSIWQSLKNIGVSGGDHYYIYILKEKLDPESQKLWARASKGRLPKWNDFNNFLIDRVRELENCPSLPQISIKTKGNTNPKSSTLLTASSPELCIFCQQEPHKLFLCPEFRVSKPSDRLAFIRNEKLCRNCITETHMTKDCTYSKCKKCNRKHNTLLHESFSYENITTNSTNPDIANQSSDTPPTTQNTLVNHIPEEISPSDEITQVPPQTVGLTSTPPLESFCRVFLGTAIINVLDQNGQVVTCRAVVDNGSQVNLMTERLAQRLNLPKIHYNFDIRGVLDIKSQGEYKVRTQFSSYDGDLYYPISCNVIPKVTGNLPNWNVDPKSIPIPKYLPLADPSWHISQSVDILIGGGLFAQLEQDESYLLGEGLPKLKRTHIGWILVGEHVPKSKLPENSSISKVSDTICTLTIQPFLGEFPKNSHAPENSNFSNQRTPELNPAKELNISSTNQIPENRFNVQTFTECNLTGPNKIKTLATGPTLSSEITDFSKSVLPPSMDCPFHHILSHGTNQSIANSQCIKNRSSPKYKMKLENNWKYHPPDESPKPSSSTAPNKRK